MRGLWILSEFKGAKIADLMGWRDPRAMENNPLHFFTATECPLSLRERAGVRE